MLSNVKHATEHPDHFAVDDGSGRPYRVAKAALSPAMVERVRRLYCGGPVKMNLGGPVSPLGLDESEPLPLPPPIPVAAPAPLVPVAVPGLTLSTGPGGATVAVPAVPPVPAAAPVAVPGLTLSTGPDGRTMATPAPPPAPVVAPAPEALTAPADATLPAEPLPMGGALTGGPSLASQLKLDLSGPMASLDPIQRALLASQAIPELKGSSLEDLAASWLANRSRAAALTDQALSFGERARDAVMKAATGAELKKFSADDGKDVQGRLNQLAEATGLKDRVALSGTLDKSALALAAKLKMAITPDGYLVPVSSLGTRLAGTEIRDSFTAGMISPAPPPAPEPSQAIESEPVEDAAVTAAVRAALPSPLTPEILAALSPLDRARLDLEAMGPLKLRPMEEGMAAAERQVALERRVAGMKAGSDKQLAALDENAAVDTRAAVNDAAERAGLQERVPGTGKLTGKDGAAVRALADRAGAVVTAEGQVVGRDEVAAAQAELAATRPAEPVRVATEAERKALGKAAATSVIEQVNAAAQAAGLKTTLDPKLGSVGPRTLALATKAGVVITADGRVMKPADLATANASAAAPRQESQLTLAGPFAQGVGVDPMRRALLGLTAPAEEAPAAEAEAAPAPATPKADGITAASGAAPAPPAPVNPFQATTLTAELAASVVGADDTKLVADYLASKGMDPAKVAAMKAEDRDKLMGDAVGAVATLRAKAIPVASEARADAFARGVDEQTAGLALEAGEDVADELSALLQAQGLDLKPGTGLAGTVKARAALLQAKADTQIQALRAAGETVKETGRLEEARLRETADLLRLQQQHQRTIDDSRVAQDRLFQEMQDPKNAELEQGRLLSRMNVGQHIGMWVMSILGGVASGVRGGPNMAMEQFNAALARDIESQKAEKDAKRSIRFREYERMGATVEQAGKLLEADAKNLAAAQLAYQGAKSGTAKAKVALDQAAAQMREQARDALSQAVVEITTQQFAAMAAERQGRILEGGERRAEAGEQRDAEMHPLRMALLRESLAKAGLRAAAGRTAARTVRVGAARDAAALIAAAPKDANGQPIGVQIPSDVRGRLGEELTTEQQAELTDDERKFYVAEEQAHPDPEKAAKGAKVVKYRRALTDKAAEQLGAAEAAFRQLDALGRMADQFREKGTDGNPIPGGGVARITGTDASRWQMAAKQAGLAIKTAEKMGALDAGSVEYMEQLLPDMTGFFRRDGTRGAQLDQYREWVSGQRKSSRQQFLIGGH